MNAKSPPLAAEHPLAKEREALLAARVAVVSAERALIIASFRAAGGDTHGAAKLAALSVTRLRYRIRSLELREELDSLAVAERWSGSSAVAAGQLRRHREERARRRAGA